jgi:hypothetical protein
VKLLRAHRHKCEDNIKLDLRRNIYAYINKIAISQDEIDWGVETCKDYINELNS